jgi:hypothetical protein
MEPENLHGDAKGKGPSGANREVESTDVPARGGLVCTENSNSDIMVMQSAKDRVGMDTSSSLNWARERRVLI